MINPLLKPRPQLPAYFLINRNKGFTIIELVLVIVLMGILAVTVAPKMFNSSGFQEYAYQAEVVASLRNIQLKAMQQTDDSMPQADGSMCLSVTVTSKLLDISNLCRPNSEPHIIDVEIDESDSIIFQTTGNADTEFFFDSLGRPVSCFNPCQIILQGSETLRVQIESEGFIHAL